MVCAGRAVADLEQQREEYMQTKSAPYTEVEPSVETISKIEAYEHPDTRMRREWAENSGDFAWQIIKFLQGKRSNEVSLIEVEQTETYKRSSELEESALRFVASQAEQQHPVSAEDRRRLIERDSFLIKFVAREHLGHQDWVTELQAIPAGVARAQAVDAAMFQTTYRAPILFRGIWGR